MVSGAHSREALGRGGRTKEAGNLSQAEDGLIKTMPGGGVRLSATKEASEGLLGQRCPKWIPSLSLASRFSTVVARSISVPSTSQCLAQGQPIGKLG